MPNDSYQKWEWNEVVPNIKKRKEVNRFLGFNYWNDGSDSLTNRVLTYRIEHRMFRTDLAKITAASDSTIERIEKILMLFLLN